MLGSVTLLRSMREKSRTDFIDSAPVRAEADGKARGPLDPPIHHPYRDHRFP